MTTNTLVTKLNPEPYTTTETTLEVTIDCDYDDARISIEIPSSQSTPSNPKFEHVFGTTVPPKGITVYDWGNEFKITIEDEGEVVTTILARTVTLKQSGQNVTKLKIPIKKV